MLKNLCEFRAKRLAEHFEEIGHIIFNDITPFIWKKVWRAKFEAFKLKNKLDLELVLSIVITEEKSRVILYEKDSTKNEGKDKIQELLIGIELTDCILKRDDYFYFKDFKFSNEEKQLYTLVSDILEGLKKINDEGV